MESKLQIIGISTKESEFSPKDIMQKFLDKAEHKILKETESGVQFSIHIDETLTATTVAFQSLKNFEKKFEKENGLNFCNCYLVIANFEDSDLDDKIEEVYNYIKENFDPSKKFFVCGLYDGISEEAKEDGEEDEKREETKEKVDEIENFFKKQQNKPQYKVKNINQNDTTEIYEFINDMLIKVDEDKSAMSVKRNLTKDEDSHGSCLIF